jgi:hypothetical protein
MAKTKLAGIPAVYYLSDMLKGVRTPAKVKAALATLKPGRRATNAQIAAWCAKAGRWPKSAEKLADIITGK